MEPTKVNDFGGVAVPPTRGHFLSQEMKRVLSYGTKLASCFHQYALIADKVPSGFEGVANILDASIATLNKVSSLFKDESSGQRYKAKDHPLNDDGLKYVTGLLNESARCLTKIGDAIEAACLPTKEYRTKKRRDDKKWKKNGKVEIDIIFSALMLDEKAFLEQLEHTKWSLVENAIEDYVERLYDIQLCLLLVFQVVTVGALSKDL
jgi:hypothetical protein